MRLLRASVAGVLLIAVMWLVGCSGGSDSVLFQNIRERPSWGTGNLFAFTSLGGNNLKYIYRCDTGGGSQYLLTIAKDTDNPTNEGGMHPSFSPDGKRVVFSGRRSSGSMSLYTMNSNDGDRSAITLITDSAAAGQDIEASFKPDATQIIYASDKPIGGVSPGSLDIVVKNADGTGSPTTLVHTGVNAEHWPVFSPDGTKIAFHRERSDVVGTVTDVWVMDLTSGIETNLTRPTAGAAVGTTRYEAPSWGTVSGEEWIYFHSNLSGDFDIWRIHPDGTSMQQVTADPRSDGYPVVSPDGKRILFVRDRELWTRDPVAGTGNETRITRAY